MEKTDYLPVNVTFKVTEQDEMPNSLGVFDSIEQVNDFINTNKIIGINQALQVERFMDSFEKGEIRKRYANILEDILPEHERILREKKQELSQAKEVEKQAQENFNAYENQAHSLAREVKRGLKDIELPDVSTFRIPVKEHYYFYTFINNELKLCAVREIPTHEKNEIFNSAKTNEELFTNGEIKAQEGEEE